MRCFDELYYDGDEQLLLRSNDFVQSHLDYNTAFEH